MLGWDDDRTAAMLADYEREVAAVFEVCPGED
jgi:hypothetical protein